MTKQEQQSLFKKGYAKAEQDFLKMIDSEIYSVCRICRHVQEINPECIECQKSLAMLDLLRKLKSTIQKETKE